MTEETTRIITYKVIAEQPQRKGRTVVCNVCGKPYTDNISPDAIEVTCAKCTMGLADAVETQKQCGRIDFDELVEAIKNNKLASFRAKYGFTQSQLAKRLGITSRHLRRMEDSSYIPSTKVIRKMEIKIKNVLSP